MNNDLPVNVSYEYKFEKQNIETAREEWNRNKTSLDKDFTLTMRILLLEMWMTKMPQLSGETPTDRCWIKKR